MDIGSSLKSSLKSRKAPHPPAPPDWPKQADDDYDRISVLGAGAFGQVLLARSKMPVESGKYAYVAIKGVSIQNEKEGATAQREIAILSELNHPNIIKLLHDYEPSSSSAKGRYMALEYVRGPDVGELLEARGALGLPLAQLIARHLISAVAYCHVRGVMHRDIKPDNIMLEGSRTKWIGENIIWEDRNLHQYRKFKAVLVDFGFARATSPRDYQQREDEKTQDKRRAFDRMKSRAIFKGMSAIGTKHFAAPEIVQTVRKRRGSENALTDCVSSYALISDAYAIGATLKEITTGVPPGEEVESYVNSNRKAQPKKNKPHPNIEKMKGAVLRRLSTSSASTYDIQLRYMHELPIEASDLINLLMMEDMDMRLSVREAQEHEWIGGYDKLPHGDVPSHHQESMVFVENELALM